MRIRLKFRFLSRVTSNSSSSLGRQTVRVSVREHGNPSHSELKRLS